MSVAFFCAQLCIPTTISTIDNCGHRSHANSGERNETGKQKITPLGLMEHHRV